MSEIIDVLLNIRLAELDGWRKDKSAYRSEFVTDENPCWCPPPGHKMCTAEGTDCLDNCDGFKPKKWQESGEMLYTKDINTVSRLEQKLNLRFQIERWLHSIHILTYRNKQFKLIHVEEFKEDDNISFVEATARATAIYKIKHNEVNNDE